jgi:uncharacterized membrane protein
LTDDPTAVAPAEAPIAPEPGDRSAGVAVDQAPDAAPHSARTGHRPLLGGPTFGGAAMALLFWWQSLMPTMLPRPWFAQAAVSAICLVVGYGIGTLVGSLVHRLLGRLDAEPAPELKAVLWTTLWGLWAAMAVIGLLAWPRLHTEQRALVDLGGVSFLAIVPMVLLTAVLAVVLVVLGRLIGRGASAVNRFNHRHLPPVVAQPATILLVLVIVVFLVRDVALQRAVEAANTAFGTLDTTTNEGTEPPTSPFVSGSPDSHAEWDTLGRQGREFVANATSIDALREFHGAGATVVEPIRIYVGNRTAGSAAEQAAVAVDELIRTGAADRSVLVVSTATGTGWIDPDAVVAVEQLHAGDTAFVSMQYSYLPSWISTFVDQGNATEAGAELFNAVYDWWSQLGAERPQLLVFGLSLGSYGAEAAFAGPDAATSVANMVARTGGALLVGPTNDNVVWRQLTAERDPGSPAWAPVFAGGRSVRFLTRDPEGERPQGPWEHPRILYLQHPSDPVTFWSFDTLWRAPEWMDQPRGYDITHRGSWFPFVTWIQGVFDLTAGFGAPPGFGHDFRLDYVNGWSLVAPPDGWTEADTRRLEAHLHRTS